VIRRAIAVAIAMGILAGEARAEDRVFTDEEAAEVDTEDWLGRVYFVDLDTYRAPPPWDEAWRAAKTGYRVSAGSLNCCLLMVEQAAKLQGQLLPYTTFRYRFEHRDDREVKSLHHWLELLVGREDGPVAFALGEPHFDKRRTVLGGGVAFRAGGRELIRAWRAVPFLLYNDPRRNPEAQDRFTRPPGTWGVSADLFQQQALRATFHVEVDDPTEWSFPDGLYRYQGARALLTAEARLGPATASVEVERAHRDEGWEAPGRPEETLAQELLAFRARPEVRADLGRVEVRGGLSAWSRAARTVRGLETDERRREEWIPYAEARVPLGEALALETGLYLDVHQGQRTWVDGAREPEPYAGAELKARVALEVRWSRNIWMFINPTVHIRFDGPYPDLWGGGNAHLLFVY